MQQFLNDIKINSVLTHLDVLAKILFVFLSAV